jgi:hypothetical protein
MNPSKEDLVDSHFISNGNSVSDSINAFRFENGVGLVSNEALNLSKKRRRSKRKKSKKHHPNGAQFENSTRNIRDLVSLSHHNQGS